MVIDGAGNAERECRAGRNEETRSRLLDGVIRLASTHGIGKVTSRAVGAQTGLSHSLVRFHFGSVDAMIGAALQHSTQLDVAEGPLIAQSIDDFGSHVVDATESNRARRLLQFDEVLRAVRGGVPVEQVIQLYDCYQSQVATTLQNVGIDDADGATAAVIFAALDGLVLQHVLYRTTDRTSGVLDRLREVLRLLQTAGAEHAPGEVP